MPELPEVEVISQGLKPHLVGRRVEAITYNGKNLRSPVPIDLMRTQLTGKQIVKVERRAKYLLVHFDLETVLIIHLGMTGNLGIFPIGSTTARHDHLCWRLDNNLELRYNDTRRFGAIHLLQLPENASLEETFFHKTGPEPLSENCSAQYLHTKATGRKQPIKTFLMNTEVIAGIGNIYANESLFKAGINPCRPAGKLSRKEWRTLLDNIRSTLNWAIECGGSTISDFINASGEKGYFQANFKVYGKTGLPCGNCLTPIKKIQLSGRASFYCPQCQKK